MLGEESPCVVTRVFFSNHVVETYYKCPLDVQNGMEQKRLDSALVPEHYGILITMCLWVSSLDCYIVPSYKFRSKTFQFIWCLYLLPTNTDICTVSSSPTCMLHVVDPSNQTWRQIFDRCCTCSSNINGLVQYCIISSALAMMILQYYTKSSICKWVLGLFGYKDSALPSYKFPL